MDAIFLGSIKNGKVTLEDISSYNEYIRGIGDNQRVEVIVRKARQSHSDCQRKYFHKVAVELIAEFTGYTKKETKEELKALFLTDPVTREVRSTASLTKEEYSEFITDVRRWAAEDLDVVIPPPEKVNV